MGTTPALALPYPEGATDKVRNGASAMQMLAEGVEDALRPGAGLVIERAESPAAAGATAVVDFPGTQPLVSDFTYSGGTVTYTGPDGRLVLVEAEVEVIHGSGSAAVSSTVEVRFNGGAFAGSHDDVGLTSGTLGSRSKVHRITTALTLQPGETIDVVASASPAGTLGKVGLRVHAIGPVTP